MGAIFFLPIPTNPVLTLQPRQLGDNGALSHRRHRHSGREAIGRDGSRRQAEIHLPPLVGYHDEIVGHAGRNYIALALDNRHCMCDDAIIIPGTSGRHITMYCRKKQKY